MRNLRGQTGRASAQAEARRQGEERRQRGQAWEEAIPRARQAYIDQLNRDRLRRQAAKSAEAGAIRDYCTRLDRLAEGGDDPATAEQIRAWAMWARQELTAWTGQAPRPAHLCDAARGRAG